MSKNHNSFSFKTTGGSETITSTASMALLHWYCRIAPQLEMPNPVPILEVLPIGRPIPSPYDPMFLVLTISGVERTYGKSLNIPEMFTDQKWYNDLPRVSNHIEIITALNDGNAKVIAYETVCLEILKWLEKNGDVFDLEYSLKG